MKRCLNGWVFSSHNFRSKLEAAKVENIFKLMIESNGYNATEF